MGPMPLRAVSFVLYAYVGWRIAPELGAPWMSAAFIAVLIASVLTLPFAFRARRTRPPRSIDRLLAWGGLVGMGLFSSLFVLTFLRDLARGAARRRPRHALGVRQRAANRGRRPHRRASGRSAAGAARLFDRPDQRCPRRPDDPAAVSRSDRRSRQPARRRHGRGDRRSRRRLGPRSRRARGAARRPAFARRQLLRHRQPRVLLRRRSLGPGVAPARPHGAHERARRPA